MNITRPKRWQLQEAKAKFSQVVDEMLDHGPQIITRHGKDIAAIVPIEDLTKLQSGSRPDADRKGAILEMLQRAPKVNLDIRRAKDLPRPGPSFE